MQGSFTPQEFLEYLNGYLKVKTPNIVETKSHEERSGKAANLFTFDSLDLGAPVDFIICGPCAGYGTIGAVDRREYNEDFPMGKCMIAKGEPDKSWLHAVLDHQNPRPKNIVVYATCCGEYNSDYKRMLKRVFPDITWHFPYVEDLCDNHHPDRIAEGLLQAGILKIVPAVAA